MSTAQFRTTFIAALILSAMVHGAVVLSMSRNFKVESELTGTILVRIERASPLTGASVGTSFPPLEKGVGGFSRRGKTKNPPTPFSKGGEEIAAQSAGEGKAENAVRTSQHAMPKVITEPKFTQRALSLRIEGEVLLGVLVGSDGRVKRATLKKRLGYGLDEEAIEAMTTSLFEPACDETGRTVEEEIDYRYKFKLRDASS